MKTKILVTGGAGFIGSEFVRQFAHRYKIAVADALTYAGDVRRLNGVRNLIQFHKCDIRSRAALERVFKSVRPQYLLHFAAATHVDRSIHDPIPFIASNVVGTQNLIDLAGKYKVKRFVHISTDEVYGDSIRGRFKETSDLKPNNPYSATKVAAEMLVRAAVRTHHLPAIILRPANNYGPWQYPEKFVPVIIYKAMHNQRVPVYGRGRQIREWLHVADCARGVETALRKGKVGEIYNVGSYYERPNLKTAQAILKYLDKPQTLIQFVQDRPGHDFRYGVNCAKLRALGWRPQITFAQGIKSTIAWYRDHVPWLQGKVRQLNALWKRVYRT